MRIALAFLFGALALSTAYAGSSFSSFKVNLPTGVTISLSASQIVAGSSNGTTLGTLSIVGTVSGTASWSLTDASGTFQVNSSTGVITVLSNTDLTSGNNIPITVSATGTTPSPPSNTPFMISVTPSVGTCNGTVDLSSGCVQAMLGGF